MEKSNIENIKVVADAENAQSHFCCSHIIFSILDFFTVLFFGCRRKGLNCYLIMGSRGIRSGVFCLLLRCIFQKIFKSCKTSYLENLENILSDRCLKTLISSVFSRHFLRRDDFYIFYIGCFLFSSVS